MENMMAIRDNKIIVDNILKFLGPKSKINFIESLNLQQYYVTRFLKICVASGDEKYHRYIRKFISHLDKYHVRLFFDYLFKNFLNHMNSKMFLDNEDLITSKRRDELICMVFQSKKLYSENFYSTFIYFPKSTLTTPKVEKKDCELEDRFEYEYKKQYKLQNVRDCRFDWFKL